MQNSSSKKIIPSRIIILRKISRFCKRVGMTERAFSLNVTNSTHLCRRLRKGEGISTRTIDAIREYIANYKG